MTAITDVPESGIYIQKGSIIQLVVQLNDANSGLPLQLQTATNLTISLLYPDLATTLTVSAQLYTDGSDGQIVYITKNSNTQIDLYQIGLYHIQGQATLGGIMQPPSAETDFYVLGNTQDTGVTPILLDVSGIILYDSNDVRWVLYVTPSGTFASIAQTSGPLNAISLNTFVLKDSDGIYWTITMQTTGVYLATLGGDYQQAITSLILQDNTGHSWVVTISTAGVLIAS